MSDMCACVWDLSPVVSLALRPATSILPVSDFKERCRHFKCSFYTTRRMSGVEVCRAARYLKLYVTKDFCCSNKYLKVANFIVKYNRAIKPYETSVLR